jgi:hypothetical protein
VDWFVPLAPLLVLAVILLLGFTGCEFHPPEPPPTLVLKVLVPSALTVNQSQFEWTQPGSTILESTTTLDRTDDGSGTVLLSHSIGDNPTLGTWAVTCRLRVQVGTRQASGTKDSTFTLDDGTPGGDAIFSTVGSPATNDFAIVFDGLVAN